MNALHPAGVFFSTALTALALIGCEEYEQNSTNDNQPVEEPTNMNNDDDTAYGPASDRQEEREDAMLYEGARFSVKSPAFEDGEPIPQKYTADGDDASPPLEWEGAPEGTQSFALVVDDPDAPGDAPFVHWVIYDIPADTSTLPEGLEHAAMIDRPRRAAQGVNSFGTNNIGWRGPSPPRADGPHHYHFTLYALDEDLDLEPGLKKEELLSRISNHVLAKAELTATYDRD